MSLCFFFFKQKTAYEIMPSLVGSEMCIRDRPPPPKAFYRKKTTRPVYQKQGLSQRRQRPHRTEKLDPHQTMARLRSLRQEKNRPAPQQPLHYGMETLPQILLPFRKTCLLYTSDAADDLLCV